MSTLLNHHIDHSKNFTWTDVIENKETVLKKWNILGFLEGIEKEYKPCLASWYEYMAIILIKDEENKYSGDDNGSVETVAFPILRRIYTRMLEDYKSEKEKNVTSYNANRFDRMKYSFIATGFEKLLEDLIRTNDILMKPTLEAYGDYMDVEAEVTAQFCNYYYSKLSSHLDDGQLKLHSRLFKIKSFKNEIENYFELLP